MFNKSSQTPLIVELMDISKQNEAILKFFISGVGSKVFKISNTSTDIEAYIIDYDFPGAQARWDENYMDSNKPRIILATHDPKAANSVWVGKPLSSKKLIEAATTIKRLQETMASTPSTSTATQDNDTIQEKPPSIPEVKPFSLVNDTKVAIPKKVSPENTTTATLVRSESLENNQARRVNPTERPIGELIDNSTPRVDQPTPDQSEKKQDTQQKKIKKPKTAEEIAAETAKQERRWKELCGELSLIHI